MPENPLPPSTSGAESPDDDRLFEVLAKSGLPIRAVSSRLKSRIFSNLVSMQAEDGPLMSLSECSRRGERLCIFEQIVAIAPIGEELKTRNPCRVCLVRVLGENVENLPIYWPGCTYATFKTE